MNKTNNKGFSYVEMIIVLAIMGIMVGFLSISISTNYRNEVSRTAEKFESRVNQARTSALTKGTANGYLNIAYVDKAYYTYVGNPYKCLSFKQSTGGLLEEDGTIPPDYKAVMFKRNMQSVSYKIDQYTGKVER